MGGGCSYCTGSENPQNEIIYDDQIPQMMDGTENGLPS